MCSLKLAKTRMAKSVLDAGWGLLKTYLQYKGQQAGRCVLIVNERNTTRDAAAVRPFGSFRSGHARCKDLGVS